MTNYLKTLALVAVVGMAGASMVRADAWDKKTVITIDEPMQLPNMTLPPGTYVVRLADVGAGADRHIVQFFNKDETKIITTMFGIPNERLRPTGKSVFAFWETPAGQPKALRAWFYPGDNFGQEFAYPKEEAAGITANNKGANVPVSDEKAPLPAAAATASNDSSVASPQTVQQTPPAAPESARDSAIQAVQASTPDPAPAPVEVAAAPQAFTRDDASVPATPVDQTSDAQLVNPSATPDKLPRTASTLPLVGLLGVLSVLCAVALNFVYRSSMSS